MKKIIFWGCFTLIICLLFSFGILSDLKTTMSNIQTGIFMGFSVAIGNMLSKQHIEKRYKKIIKNLNIKKKRKNKKLIYF